MDTHELDLLYLEDDEDHAVLFMDMLSSIELSELKVTHKTSLQAGIDAISEKDFNAVILDLGLPETQGLETLSRFMPYCPHIPVVVLTTNNDLQLSVEAIKSGAQDFLVKGEISADIIERTLRYSIERFEILNELEEKNESLNTFAMAASHDLKTPLRNILVTVDFFRSDHGDMLPPGGLEALSHIQAAVNRLQNLIDSLMEFTKSEAKPPVSGFFSISSCIDDALLLMGAAVKKAQAKVSIDSDLPKVYGNQSLLVRVFQNLINNAIQYIENRTPEIHIGYKESGNEYIFHVADNGIGIERKYLDKVFEPLKRLHTQQKYAGSGIGLSLCKRIISAHSGRIWADSTPGEGSTFYFSLPKINTLLNDHLN